MKPARLFAIVRFAPLSLSLAVVIGAADPAQAQSSGPSSVLMAEEPLALAPVGLEVQIPADASGFRADRGDVPTLEVSPMLGHWFMMIQAPQQQGIDVQSQVGGKLPVDHLTDRILENLLGSYRMDQAGTEAIESKARVLLRETGLVVAGRPASRFYVAFPEGDRERIRMYTLVDAGAGQMVRFDLFCEPEDEREARLAYLAILASAQFSGNTKVAVARAFAIETTEALLETLTAADYERAIAQVADRWDRLSVPASTGLTMDDTERGYRWIRAWKGQRGEIDPERSKESWSEDDHAEGYLVRLDGRMIERWRRDQWTLIDTRIICFMTADRQHESWTASTTFRQGDQRPIVNTEIGIRDDQIMKIARRGSTSNTLRPSVPPRGYVSQVELYLLPQLLIGQGAEMTYGVYAYSGGDTNVRYREFELEASQGQASWKLSADLSDEARSISLFNSAGGFLGSERGDDSRLTPTTRQDLLDLWNRKQLPTSVR